MLWLTELGNHLQLIRFIGCSSRSYLSLNVLLFGFSLHGYLLSSMLLSFNRFSCIAFPLSFSAVSLAVTLSICAFVTVGSLILNTWTFIRWKKYRNNVSTSIYRTQRKMFIFSVITFVLSSCICLQQLIANAVMFTGNMELAATLFGLYSPLSSIAILIDPYSIVIFSPSLRKEVLAFVSRRGATVWWRWLQYRTTTQIE